MARLPNDINLDDLSPDLFLELDWVSSDSIYSQSPLGRQPAAVAETSMSPAAQHGYDPYESFAPVGEHFTAASPSTQRRPNQNTTQYFAANNNNSRALDTAFDGFMDHTTHTTPLVASPLTYPRQNQNTAQYFAANSNNPQALAAAFDGFMDHTTRTTSIVASSPGQPPPWQQPSYPGVTALGAVSNGFTNGGMAHSPNHGLEQVNPDTILRCDWPGCTYTGTFTVKGSLKRHRDEQHTSPQSFPCPICGKPYSRNSHLTYHQLKTHGIRA
ncbi:hypothetical protein N7471_007493 [Penicillium samsonianum]|uniref:uncharacterized protein n=1 Tax=Penicillium samsonianum TaxID=1882272 RepID=UPI0025484063|nr:uncharacterized protein N7471_007493 [Penicillium samsonianum]KAJ6132278.1 hypothetical protein N7471_007493 [Penicillium samsonianum]